ncbi:MAG TPA: aminoacyl-tRNA hydrolase [Burkholderiaceae bacterium]|nr:aminoacyl-tRNA hydrolase [Burkholderiaceae bacterium]
MTTPVRLIVGLGNPGPKYEATRHNAGFWLVDHYADDLSTTFTEEKPFFSSVAKARSDEGVVILAKPTTYMNRSGQAVGALMRFYKFTPAQVLVVHDELDLAPGQAKIKRGGGHAGHNGLRDIQSALGSTDFWRLRIGIGHPRVAGLEQPVASYVLHVPRPDELDAMVSAIQRLRDILPHLLAGEFEAATRLLHAGNR